MGWLSFSMHRPVKEWFKDEVDKKYEVLDSALVQRTTFYSAVKNKETGQVICAVCLIRWSPRSWDNFCYKDMTEFSGPCQVNCPKRIMKLLSPLNDENDPNGWAGEWRTRVGEYWKKKEELKKNKLAIIKTKEIVKFIGGMEYQYFQKIGRTLWGGKLGEHGFIGHCRVRVNLSHYEYEFI
jgi:hypothetical protein